jgi:hypothetical protein
MSAITQIWVFFYRLIDTQNLYEISHLKITFSAKTSNRYLPNESKLSLFYSDDSDVCGLYQRGVLFSIVLETRRCLLQEGHAECGGLYRRIGGCGDHKAVCSNFAHQGRLSLNLRIDSYPKDIILSSNLRMSIIINSYAAKNRAKNRFSSLIINSSSVKELIR